MLGRTVSAPARNCNDHNKYGVFGRDRWGAWVGFRNTGSAPAQNERFSGLRVRFRAAPLSGRNTARATVGGSLAVSAFPRYVPV